MKLIPYLSLLAFLNVIAPALPAQGGEEVDIKELIKQIRRNMMEVEKEIDRVESEAASDQAARAKENLDKLVESMKGRSDQIASDIDEIIKNMKPGQGKGQGQGQGQSKGKGKSQGKPKSRDGNRRENEGQRPQNSDGQPRDGSDEDNTEKDQAGGRNKDGNKKPEPKRVRVPVNWDEERWGHLPPELRQRLIDRNFKDFTPPYAQELKEYYKKIGRGK